MQAYVLHLHSRQGRIIVRRQQSSLARKNLGDRVTCLLRETIAVARGTCHRIGFASCSDNYGIKAVEFLQALDFMPISHINSQLQDATLQRPGDVTGHQRGRKSPLSLLHYRGHAERLEETQRILVRKGVERMLQEALVRMDVSGELFPWTHVRQIAAAFAGKIDFPAKALVLIEKHDARSVAERFGSPDRCHHAGRSASDYGKLSRHYWNFLSSASRMMYMLSSMSPVELLLYALELQTNAPLIPVSVCPTQMVAVPAMLPPW